MKVCRHTVSKQITMHEYVPMYSLRFTFNLTSPEPGDGSEKDSNSDGRTVNGTGPIFKRMLIDVQKIPLKHLIVFLRPLLKNVRIP